MTTISVPDMMCENCVKRITNALTAAELKFSVSLDTKTVTVDGCDNCVKTAVSEAGGSGLHAGGPLNPLKTEGVPQQVPRLNRQAPGSVFLRRFYVTNLLLFLFFLQTFAQLDRVVFLQSGRHNTATPTKT